MAVLDERSRGALTGIRVIELADEQAESEMKKLA